MSTPKVDMSIYEEMYRKVNELPAQQRLEVLITIAPPPVLFSKMDGTMFRIRVLGLTMFDTKSMLSEVGIKKDDPRSQIYKYLKGSLIDTDIIKKLRNISARQDTVAKETGGIAIRGDDKRSKVWWIPIDSTSSFKQKTLDLQSEIRIYVAETLIAPYVKIKNEAREKYAAAVRAAYKSIKDKKTIEEQFFDANMRMFEEKFPSIQKIELIRMEVFPIQAPLPPVIENTLSELARLQREESISKLELNELQKQIRRAELSEIEERHRSERELRREMLREQISPEIEKVNGIVLEIQKTIVKLANEIFPAIKNGAKISSAQRRSWKNTIEQLSSLSMADDTNIEKALTQLKSMALETENFSSDSLNNANQVVAKALAEIERQANLEVQGASLWQMIENGDGETLMNIQKLKNQFQEQIFTLETLEDVATMQGAALYQEELEMPI